MIGARAAAILFTLGLFSCEQVPSIVGVVPQTRSKLTWPFAEKSFWNTPIGSGARYVPAGIAGSGNFNVNEDRFVAGTPTDPLQTLYSPATFGQGRCSSTQRPTGVRVAVPDALIIPDASTMPYLTPASCVTFLAPDGITIRDVALTARCVAGGPVFGNPTDSDDTIYGNGVKGAYGSSGISCIGGTLRWADVMNGGAIRHALKIKLWGKRYLFYDAASPTPGYRWPAAHADGTAATVYSGSNPQLVIGSLLAVPLDVGEATLNLETDLGRRLFETLRDFGAYVIGDAGFDVHEMDFESGLWPSLVRDDGFSGDPTGRFGRDVDRLFSALAVVTNNTADNVGGGGTPRALPAPRFRD